MPDATRPRQVTFTTPPFIDPSLLGGNTDPYAEVTRLLTELQGQQYQPPQPGKLETILGALAQGAAIAASPDPGGTLSNFIKQRSDIKQNEIQQERQRQQQLQVAKIQTSIDKAKGLQQEQANTRSKLIDLAIDTEKSKRDLANYSKKGDIDLAIEAQKFRQNEALAQEFEPLRNARARNQALINLIPQQDQARVELVARMTGIVPDMPVQVANDIARKISSNFSSAAYSNDQLKDMQAAGSFTSVLNPVEAQWFRTYNDRFKELSDQDREIKKRLTNAQIGELEASATEKKAQATYYENILKFGNGYEKALNQEAAKEAVNQISTQYYKNRETGAIYTKEQVLAGVLGSLGSQPLSPEENAKEQQNAIKRINDLREQQSQKITQTLPGQPTPQPQVPFENSQAFRIITNARLQGIGWDTIISNINTSTKLTPEDKKKAQEYIQSQIKNAGTIQR